jgi:hypothetical protein
VHLAEAQFAIDTELYKAGRAKGYDAIVLLSLGLLSEQSWPALLGSADRQLNWQWI